MMVPTVIAAISATLLLSSGYLFGARRGVAARRALREAAELAQARRHTLEIRVAELTQSANEAARMRTELDRATRRLVDRDEQGQVVALQDELRTLSAMIRDREASDANLRAELRNEMMELARGSQDPVRFERELKRIVGRCSSGRTTTRGSAT